MRGRRLRRRQAFAFTVLVPVIAAGTAFLAENNMSVSSAGVMDVPVQGTIVTNLVVIDPGSNAKVNIAQLDHELDSYHFIHIGAQLTTADGAPIANAVILFTADTSRGSTAGDGLICSAVTGPNGAASCPDSTKIPTSEFSGVPAMFTATFAAHDALRGATVSACLDVVGAGGSGSKCP